MTLIIRRPPKKTFKHWVEKDAEGNVTSAGYSHITGAQANRTETFASENDAQASYPVLAQIEAENLVYSEFDLKWQEYQQWIIYNKKVDDVKAYRASQAADPNALVISSLLQREADARSITVEALVVMIEGRAFADQAMEDAEIARIVEKLTLP